MVYEWIMYYKFDCVCRNMNVCTYVRICDEFVCRHAITLTSMVTVIMIYKFIRIIVI